MRYYSLSPSIWNTSFVKKSFCKTLLYNIYINNRTPPLFIPPLVPGRKGIIDLVLPRVNRCRFSRGSRISAREQVLRPGLQAISSTMLTPIPLCAPKQHVGVEAACYAGAAVFDSQSDGSGC